MRDIVTKVYHVANKAYDLAALPIFVALVASAFVGDGFAHDLFRYVIQPVGVFVVLRWVVRWGWRRYEAAPGFHGFVPHKTPWAP